MPPQTLDTNLNNTYADLCTQVYDLSKPEPTPEVYAFYRDYVMASNGPILEPMCGSGRFLIPFLEEGFTIHGFDTSQAMLNALTHKASTKKLTPTVWNGAIQTLNCKQTYALIFIPAGSFGLITTPEDIQASLQKMHQHLQPGGTLLFEIETSHAVPQPQHVWHHSVWDLPHQKNHQITASYCSAINNDICTVNARYTLLASNKTLRTEHETYKIKLYDTYIDLFSTLKNLGFEHIKCFKAYDKTQKPAPNDSIMMVECIAT